MSSAEIANLLLGLVATVAVVSAVGGIACVIVGHPARKNLPEHTPPVTIFKPLKGLDEGLEQNLRSFFLLDYPCFQLLFCVADHDDPAIDVVRKLMSEFPDRDAQLIDRLPGVRAQPEGREPGGDGPSSQARRDPDQRFERPGPAVLPSRDRLLSGRSRRRARVQPLRRRGRSAPGRGDGEPSAQRLHRGGRGRGGGVSRNLRGRQIDAPAREGAAGDRRFRGGSQRAGRGSGHRDCGFVRPATRSV